MRVAGTRSASALAESAIGFMYLLRRTSPGWMGCNLFVVISVTSMTIDNFYVERITFMPAKTQTPLLVDADTVLTSYDCPASCAENSVLRPCPT